VNGPTTLGETTVQLDELSYREGVSGWRAKDPKRVAECLSIIYDGLWGMTGLCSITVLPASAVDVDGMRLIDDGLAMGTSLDEARTAYEMNDRTNPHGKPWDKNVVDIITNGLKCKEVTYGVGEPRFVRVRWNVGKHLEESNSMKFTALVTILEVVESTRTMLGGVWSKVSARRCCLRASVALVGLRFF